jgi:hypothetical protein
LGVQRCTCPRHDAGVTASPGRLGRQVPFPPVRAARRRNARSRGRTAPSAPASPWRSLHQFVTARLPLLDDGQKALAAGRVQPLSPGVVEEIIDVLGDVNARDLLAALRVEDHDERRLPAPDEHTPCRRVQGERVVGRHLVLLRVDHHDLTWGKTVDEQPPSGAVELKRLRPPRQLDGGFDLELFRVDHRQRLLGVGDVHPAGARIVADVVRVGQGEGFEQGVVPPVEEVADAVRPVAHEDAVEARGVGGLLDLPLAGHLLDELAGLEVHDVQAVVREVGDEQAVPPGIERQVVEAALRPFEWDRLHQLQRRRPRRDARDGCCQRD